MLNVKFSQEEIDRLFKERYLHPHPRVQKRLEAMYLKSQGISHREIMRLVKVSTRGLVQWIRAYQDGGIEALKKLEWKGSSTPLSKHRGTLEEYFKKHPPISVKDACTKIEELTGIRRSETPVRNFLKSMGMSFRKTGNVPGKADPEKQEEFKKKDSSHFYKKQKKAREKLSSSMQHTLSGRGSWVTYGA
jgi:transposase